MARQPRRYPRQQHDGDLFPELVDVLLLGWSAPVREDADPGNAFRIFLYQDTDLQRVWRAHRAWLQKEAQRRGIETPWAQDRFEDNAPPWLAEDDA